jgi:hypothetical protein
LRQASDDAAGPARYLEVTADLERAIELGVDAQRAIAYGQHVGSTAVRLAAGRELDVVMRTVTVGLVFGGAAATQSGPQLGFARDVELAPDRVRAGLANRQEIYWGSLLVRLAVATLVADGAGRASVCDFDQARGVDAVGLNPRALDVGEEDECSACLRKLA